MVVVAILAVASTCTIAPPGPSGQFVAGTLNVTVRVSPGLREIELVPDGPAQGSGAGVMPKTEYGVCFDVKPLVTVVVAEEQFVTLNFASMVANRVTFLPVFA